MTIIEIEDAIYDWVNGLLSMTAIFAYPDAPRPTTSYVLINILTDLQIGTEESDKELTPVYSTLNEITISINTYYSGAFQKAIDIKKSLMKTEVKEQLFDSGLGFVSSTQIQKIPELIDKKWEERAQFDIVFNVRETTTIETVGSIEEIELTNEIDNTTIIIGD